MKILNKLQIKLSKHYGIYIYMPFLILLFYLYNYSLKDYLFPNNILLTIILIINLLFILLLNYKYLTKKYVCRNRLLFLSIFLLIAIIFLNNRDVYFGHFGDPFFILYSFSLIFILGSNREWIRPFIILIVLFTAEHIFGTLIEYFCPDFYISYVFPYLKDFPEELIYQFKHGQMAGFTLHYSTNAIYLSIGTIVLPFCKEYFNKNKLTKIIYYITLSLSLVCLFMTGKRAPVVFSILVLFVVFILKNKDDIISNIKKYIKYLLCLVIAFLVIAFLIPSMLNPFKRIYNSIYEGNLLNGREVLYDNAVDAIKESPLLGNGWGSYKYIYQTQKFSRDIKYMDTHNIYLQLIAEVGVIGALFFYTIFITLLIKSYRIMIKNKNNNLLSIPFAIHLYMLIYGLFGNPIYDVVFFVKYIILITIMFAYDNSNNYIIKRKHHHSCDIGIITFQDTVNYGAKLQEFSLQYFINNKLNKNCEIIEYNNEQISKNERPNGKIMPSGIKTIIKSILLDNCLYKKWEKFEKFTDKYIYRSKEKYSKSNFKLLDDRYNKIIVGSDQIWNYELTGNDSNYYLSQLNNVKKYSYAASFGTSYIVNSKEIKNYLKSFDKISVREKNAVEMINNIDALQRVFHVCDPTFLVSKDDWEREFNLKKKKQDYIFVYMLNFQKENFDYIRKIAKIQKLKIIYFNDSIRIFSKMKSIHDGGIEEFLDYIYNAKYVVTGSFHCICMSIILNKNFYYTINSNNKNSRLISLLKQYNLENRLLSPQVFNNKKFSSINYYIVNKKVDTFRNLSILYLEDIINS